MIYNKHGEPPHESGSKSELDENFNSKEFIQLPQAVLINDIIHSDKRIKDSFLDEIRNEYKLKKYDGYDVYSFTIDNEYLTEVMAVLVISSKFPDGAKFIDLILIKEKYRGHGLSKQILDFAVSKGAYWLTVYEDNEIAKLVYKKYGFETNYIDYKNSLRVMLLKSKARKFEFEDLKDYKYPLPTDFIKLYGNRKPTEARHILKLYDHVAFILEYKRNKTVVIKVYDNLIDVKGIMPMLFDYIDTLYYPVKGYSWECM